MKKILVFLVILLNISILSAQLDRMDVDSDIIDDIKDKIPVKDFIYYSRIGILNLNVGKVYDAKQAFEKALSYNVDDKRIYNLLGVVYDRLNNFDKALSFFDKSLNIDKNYLPALVNKAITYYHKDELDLSMEILRNIYKQNKNMNFLKYNIAMIYMKKNRYVKAETLFHELLKNNYPKKGEVYIQLAYLFSKRDNKNKLEDYINKAKKEAKYDAFIYYMTGIIYKNLDQNIKARSNFLKAISLKKGYFSAYYELALINYRLEEIEKAKNILKSALEIIPYHVEASLKLAELNYVKKNYKKINKILDKLLYNTQRNEKVYAYNLMFSIILNQGKKTKQLLNKIKMNKITGNYLNVAKLFYDYNKGKIDNLSINIAKVRKYHDRTKDFPLTYILLSDLLYENNETTAALQFIKEGLKISPYFYKMRYILGNIYKDSGMGELAVREYKNYLKYYPNHVSAYNQIGVIYLEDKQYDKAMNFFKKGLNQDENYAPIYNNMGLLYENKNKTKKALEYYDKTIELNKDFIEAWNNKIFLLIKLKKYGRAIKQWEKIEGKWSNNPNFIRIKNEIEKIKNIIEWTQDKKGANSD